MRKKFTYWQVKQGTLYVALFLCGCCCMAYRDWYINKYKTRPMDETVFHMFLERQKERGREI